MRRHEVIKLGAWDYRVRRFDGWALEVIGGCEPSIEESPTVLLRFLGVTYVECPMYFSHSIVRLATADERLRIGQREALEDDQEVFAIKAKSMGQEGAQVFYIVADKVEIVRFPHVRNAPAPP